MVAALRLHSVGLKCAPVFCYAASDHIPSNCHLRSDWSLFSFPASFFYFFS